MDEVDSVNEIGFTCDLLRDPTNGSGADTSCEYHGIRSDPCCEPRSRLVLPPDLCDIERDPVSEVREAREPP